MHNTTSFTKKPSSFLISFEGIEGSGKSTQIDLLINTLTKKNKSVTYLREPGGTEFGEQLRSAILTSQNPLHPLAEAHLFASARAQLLYEKVIPLLEKENQVIILDRYIDSSIAYQGFARALGAKTIIDLHQNFPLNITCDLTFYLKINLETSMQRQKARGNEKDYFEKNNTQFYQDLIEGYNYCAEYFKHIYTIDANTTIDSIAKQIEVKTMELISGKA